VPYPDREDDGQDQNKTEDELDAEALKAYLWMKQGKDRREIATTLGISQRTLIRRLQRAILSPVPTEVRREIELDRLEDLTQRIDRALQGTVSNQDLALLVREARQLGQARARLMGLTLAPSNSDTPGDQFENLPPALRKAAEEAERRIAARGEELRRGQAS
jgi:DNA-binding transcriptional regulator LsrR (DeoR family)